MTALPGVLAEELALVKSFVDLLNAEQVLLKNASPGGLDSIQEKKLLLVAQLNQVASQRQNATNTAGGDDKTAMANWLAAHPGDKASARLWNETLQLAREAKSLHDLNGQLLQMHLQRTGEALSILTQRQSSGNLLYGSNGQAATFSGSRIVDSA